MKTEPHLTELSAAQLARKERDTLKRRRDRLQADVVDSLIENYLPQLGAQV